MKELKDAFNITVKVPEIWGGREAWLLQVDYNKLDFQMMWYPLHLCIPMGHRNHLRKINHGDLLLLINLEEEKFSQKITRNSLVK